MKLSGNDLVTRFIAGTKWDVLPEPVQRKVRMCMLDDLGATLVGTLTMISRITADYAMETWPGDEATIVLHGKASAIGAAFANGYAANGFDIDDCALYTRGHPGAQVFPTALAISEKLGLGGREMLTAMVIGYEIAHRAARCWHNHHRVYFTRPAAPGARWPVLRWLRTCWACRWSRLITPWALLSTTPPICL